VGLGTGPLEAGCFVRGRTDIQFWLSGNSGHPGHRNTVTRWGQDGPRFGRARSRRREAAPLLELPRLERTERSVGFVTRAAPGESSGSIRRATSRALGVVGRPRKVPRDGISQRGHTPGMRLTPLILIGLVTCGGLATTGSGGGSTGSGGSLGAGGSVGTGGSSGSGGAGAAGTSGAGDSSGSGGSSGAGGSSGSGIDASNGDSATVTCTGGGGCDCSAGETCTHDCKHGFCESHCAAGSTCTNICGGRNQFTGGHCIFYCAVGARCINMCPDGACEFHCPAGSMCTNTCGGAQACETLK